MTNKNICILGGTGFVGRRVAALLTDAGYSMLIPTRHRARHRDLLVLPTVEVVEGDVHDPVFLRRIFADKGTVINLVGILNERGRSGRGFAAAHVELPAKIVDACHHAGVGRLLHMSALNAAPDAPSFYLRTKAEGEALVHRAANAEFHVTSFRPSVIFGARDSFTNRFANLLKLAPFAFPLACPHSHFQPVYVNDVANVFVAALENHKTFGKSYSLCGPKVYTLQEIVTYIAGLLGLRRRIVEMSDALSYMQAMALEFFPGKPFSLDNYRSLKVDSVCTEGFPKIFGIVPTALEDVAPTYLGSGTDDHFSLIRSQTRRR